MKTERWSKLEQRARDTRDKQREHVVQLQGKYQTQLARIEQLTELHKDYSARLCQLGQKEHSPQQARHIREFLSRIHELQCSSQTHLDTLDKAIKAAQKALLSKEHDRLKFEVLDKKLQQQMQHYEHLLEQKLNEASGTTQFLRQKSAAGTSLAS